MKRHNLKYLILFGIGLLLCVALVWYILGIKKNLGKTVDSQKAPDEVVVIEDGIRKAEALRLFRYLLDTDAEREALENNFPFTGKDGEKQLRCGEFSEMLAKVCQGLGIRMEELVLRFPEQLKRARNRDEVELRDFLQVYYLCLEAVAGSEDAKTTVPIGRTSFLVVSVQEENGETYFVAEDGKRYRCGQLRDYSAIFSGEGVSERTRESLNDYRYEVLEVLHCENELVFITGYGDSEVTIPNALVIQGEGKRLECYINGEYCNFSCEFPLAEQIEQQVADIIVQEKQVSGLVLKPDTIEGKVLLTGSGQIEVEGYGMLPLQEDYRIYKLYEGYSMEQTNSILVGYSNVTFVLEGESICAALITEAIKAENIRVLISVNGTANYLHDEIVISSDEVFDVVSGDERKEYQPGGELQVTYKELKEQKERIYIDTRTESGKLRVKSIRRSYGEPVYRGTLEIVATDGGLLLVNELSLEEYLYAVVPSEMPTAHGEEAMKVQAVCARSYAYQQLMANRYAKYGAHVDDTVNCQVYNNVAENHSSVYAVKDTYGKVMKYGESVISAFYFSTSSGYTSSIGDVWEEYDALPYFRGQIQLTQDSQKVLLEEAVKQGIITKTEESAAIEKILESVDLSEENAFREFIDTETVGIGAGEQRLKKKVRTYDSEFSWYRWQTTLNAEALAAQLDRLIRVRYRANPKDVLTLISHEGEFTTPSGATIKGEFAQVDIATVGRIQGIEVISRARSGMATELLIRGTANTVLVRNQTNIRTLLAPENTTVYLANDVTVESFSLLPSAFFYIEAGTKDGEAVFVIRGGGYGHGVGMSQNGVKSLAQAGYTYEGILEHYYKGVTIGMIY